MSRIQEALSKAAREKADRASVEPVRDVVDIASEARRSSEAPPPARPAAVNPDLETRGYSAAFEEIESRCAHVEWKLDPQVNLFIKGTKGKVVAERFRTLRSRLYQIADTRPLKRIMITSSVSSEGKSFVCANLAQSLVHHQNRRVLLIDADLRLPSLHRLLSASRTPGLTNYLRGDVDEFKVIQKGTENNLYFIPAGEEVTTPSELLLNDRMKKLMDFASETFDWVIIDSPPALPVHDPSMLASLCDGVLFVVRAASTDVDLAVKASSEFRQKNLLGVVFNHAEPGETYGGAYYGT